MADQEPPTEPGWYRRTKDGWARICDADQTPNDLLIAAYALDLVKVERDHEDVPLW